MCVKKLAKWFRFCDNTQCFVFKGHPIIAVRSRTKAKWEVGWYTGYVFVSIAFGVNIVSVSNTNGGSKSFLVYNYFCTLNNTCNYILDGAPTIWLYHLLYKQPFMPSVVLNHFCCLCPANDLTEPIYKGQAVDQYKRNINKLNTEKTQPRKKTKISTTTTCRKLKGSTKLFCYFDFNVSSTLNKIPKQNQRSTTNIK